jgi:hypothetical protein
LSSRMAPTGAEMLEGVCGAWKLDTGFVDVARALIVASGPDAKDSTPAATGGVAESTSSPPAPLAAKRCLGVFTLVAILIRSCSSPRRSRGGCAGGSANLASRSFSGSNSSPPGMRPAGRLTMRTGRQGLAGRCRASERTSLELFSRACAARRCPPSRRTSSAATKSGGVAFFGPLPIGCAGWRIGQSNKQVGSAFEAVPFPTRSTLQRSPNGAHAYSSWGVRPHDVGRRSCRQAPECRGFLSWGNTSLTAPSEQFRTPFARKCLQ